MSTILVVPSADPHRCLQLNMAEIYTAENRFGEIAIVNTHKAPELMTCFIKAYAWTVEHLTNLTAEAVKAENAADFRKAEIILEDVPRVLKDKGITGKSNEDYRNAVIAMDKKHIELRDLHQHIEMYRELIKGKQGSIDRAYMAVRKIFGSSMEFGNRSLGSNWSEPSYDPPPHTPNPAYVEIKPPSPTTAPLNTSSIRSGFGRARD